MKFSSSQVKKVRKGQIFKIYFAKKDLSDADSHQQSDGTISFLVGYNSQNIAFAKIAVDSRPNSSVGRALDPWAYRKWEPGSSLFGVRCLLLFWAVSGMWSR